MAQKEIKSLIGVRGIAAYYVCVYHFYQYFALTRPNSVYVTNKWAHSLFNHGYLAVDLFFILSAFVITLSSSKLFD